MSRCDCCDCYDPYDIAACADGAAGWDPEIFEPGPYDRGVGDGPDEWEDQ